MTDGIEYSVQQSVTHEFSTEMSVDEFQTNIIADNSMETGTTELKSLLKNESTSGRDFTQSVNRVTASMFDQTQITASSRYVTSSTTPAFAILSTTTHPSLDLSKMVSELREKVDREMQPIRNHLLTLFHMSLGIERRVRSLQPPEPRIVATVKHLQSEILNCLGLAKEVNMPSDILLNAQQRKKFFGLLREMEGFGFAFFHRSLSVGQHFRRKIFRSSFGKSIYYDISKSAHNFAELSIKFRTKVVNLRQNVYIDLKQNFDRVKRATRPKVDDDSSINSTRDEAMGEERSEVRIY